MFDPLRLSTELVFTAIVVFLCLIIYFKTREIYNLTKHKGIGFFRNTFLFLALAYLFRLIMSLFRIITFGPNFHIPGRELMPISLLLTGYLSTMAIIFLTYSITWKKIKIKNLTFYANLFAIIIACVSVLINEHVFLMVMQATIFIIGLIMNLSIKEKTKKHSKIFVLYLLILLFWMLNLFSIGPKRHITTEWIIISDIISIALFIIIFLRVKKWVQ